MTIEVKAPLEGTIVAVENVPDPVFAGKFVGPGIAIDPVRADEVIAVAPVSGTIAKVHPHAFVIVTAQGKGILVHLGLDTVQLAGEGFTVHAAEGTEIAVGDPMVTWSTTGIEAGGRNPIVPIIALEADEETLTIVATPGTHVAAGETILSLA